MAGCGVCPGPGAAAAGDGMAGGFLPARRQISIRYFHAAFASTGFGPVSFSRSDGDDRPHGGTAGRTLERPRPGNRAHRAARGALRGNRSGLVRGHGERPAAGIQSDGKARPGYGRARRAAAGRIRFESLERRRACGCRRRFSGLRPGGRVRRSPVASHRLCNPRRPHSQPDALRAADSESQGPGRGADGRGESRSGAWCGAAVSRRCAREFPGPCGADYRLAPGW